MLHCSGCTVTAILLLDQPANIVRLTDRLDTVEVMDLLIDLRTVEGFLIKLGASMYHDACIN